MILRLAACEIHLTPEGVDTRLPDGASVLGHPHATASYLSTARAHGYGDDVARMNRTHETTHTLLAHILGLPCSPVFRRLASGDHEEDALLRAEEQAVLSLEAYANALGVDLIEVAKGWSG